MPKILPKDKFDYQSVIELILRIEENNNIGAYKFEGISIWPLVRQQLWSNLQSKNEIPGKNLLAGEYKSNWNFKTILNSSLRLLISLFKFKTYNEVYKNYNSYLDCKSESNTLLKIITNKEDTHKRSVLLHSKSIYYQMNDKDGRVNVHIDPIYDIYHQSNIPVYKINFKESDRVDDALIDSASVDVNVFKNHYANYINPNSNRREIRRKKQLLMCLSEVQSDIEKTINKDNVVYVNYEKLVNEILYYSWFFNFIFERLRQQIRCIYTNCYYNFETMLLIHMAKKYKILTIDMQHGKQGSPHGMYTHWINMPCEGYTTLPDIFLNWGAESANSINISIPECAATKHKAVVAGYPRVSYFNNGKYNISHTSDEIKFLDSLSQYDQVILFTMQPQNKIPEFVLEGVSRLSGNSMMLIRMHPNMGLCEQKAIEEDLLVWGLENYDINFASSVELYTLLKNVSLHITKWSSVCFEATIFKIPTIIVGSVGKKLYRDKINNGEFMYADNAASLLSGISNPKFNDNDYIIDDIDYITRMALSIYKDGNGSDKFRRNAS